MRRGSARGQRPSHHERRCCRGLHGLPAPAAPGQRHGLRRPHHDDRPHAPGLPRRRRALPAPVPARPRRRVPGHQPSRSTSWSSELVGPAPGRRAGARGAAGRAVRRRRRRPVDLRLPRRDDPQHRGVRAGLPRRPDHPARAELPLDADHPAGRQRGHRPQREPPRQEPLDRLRRRRADRRLRRRQRARRGGVRRAADRPPQRRPRASAPRTSRSSTAPTPSPARSRRCSSGSACPTRSSAARGSTSARRSRTPSPTCASSRTPPTRSTCGASSTCPSAASATGRRPASPQLAERERIPFVAALGRPDDAPGIATRSVAAIKGFTALLEALARVWADGLRRRRAARGGPRPERVPRRAAGQPDPQDETRIENLAELVEVAREFDDERIETGEVISLEDFLERVSLVADADEIPSDARRGRRRASSP